MAEEVMRRPSRAQIHALAFLDRNGGLAVPNMNMAGRSKEWPDKRTLDALLRRKLIDFTQQEYEWCVDINAAGRSALRAQQEKR